MPPNVIPWTWDYQSYPCVTHIKQSSIFSHMLEDCFYHAQPASPVKEISLLSDFVSCAEKDSHVNLLHHLSVSTFGDTFDTMWYLLFIFCESISLCMQTTLASIPSIESQTLTYCDVIKFCMQAGAPSTPGIGSQTMNYLRRVSGMRSLSRPPQGGSSEDVDSIIRQGFRSIASSIATVSSPTKEKERVDEAGNAILGGELLVNIVDAQVCCWKILTTPWLQTASATPREAVVSPHDWFSLMLTKLCNQLMRQSVQYISLRNLLILVNRWCKDPSRRWRWCHYLINWLQSKHIHSLFASDVLACNKTFSTCYQGAAI